MIKELMFPLISSARKLFVGGCVNLQAAKKVIFLMAVLKGLTMLTMKKKKKFFFLPFKNKQELQEVLKFPIKIF